jgi:[protein-PII] uridylyltransferase
MTLLSAETPPPSDLSQTVQNAEQIIDRIALDRAIDQTAWRIGDSEHLRRTLLEMLRPVLKAGQAEIRRRLESGASGGRASVSETTYLVDQLVCALFRAGITHAYPIVNPTTGELFCLAGTGGYGRGEMAPLSDVDLLFLLPYKQTSRVEQLVEFMLYVLWDLGLKVGHAVRSVDDCIRLSRKDLTIRTALLESRFLIGHEPLFEELRARFAREVVHGTAPQFIRDKLAERDERHTRWGDSRYVLEPNVKEGKGGLRDLHTLFWIFKYAYQVDTAHELVGRGVFTPEEAARFAKAQDFLWTVRCHLHALTGRAEDRLTFDVQKEISSRLHYTDHAGTQGVERFMKHYFLIAKDVGDLTRVLCAHLESETKRPAGFALLRHLQTAQKEIEGFRNDAGRLSVLHDRQFRDNPVDMIRLFAVRHRHKLDIHPQALRLISRDLKAIGNKVRADAEANRLFVEILSSPADPAPTLRMMNEAGVLGRFVPDFGRVVAQMQFDMYHCYTVDEHTLFAVGIVHEIEAGKLREELPLATQLFDHIRADASSRRALYAAMFLHDVAKGRGGDHSILGSRVARKVCPRWGFTAEETETVAWLVRWHLAMSDAAFKRDLEDPKTIEDMAVLVRSPQRLRLLLILTASDIRAVGPGRWNNWKASLLRQLYHRTNDQLTGGLDTESAERRVAALREQVSALLLADKTAGGKGGKAGGWTADEIASVLGRGYPAYWLGFPPETLAAQGAFMLRAEREGRKLAVDIQAQKRRDVATVTVYTQDHAGLFSRLAGAVAASGASIVDARIFTMSNGMALDVFTIQDQRGATPEALGTLDRLPDILERALAGRLNVQRELTKRRVAARSKTRVFDVPSRVMVDNTASKNHTVIEINGRDRIGLLYELTRTLTRLNLQIASAKIGTYGSAVVDVFYVKDLFGMKVTHEGKLGQIRRALEEALREGQSEAA